MLASRHVLVTGGTGLFGRSLVCRLIAAGHSVRVLTRGRRETPHPSAVICNGDLAHAGDIAAALQGCDVVFHCAAEKRDVTKMVATNVLATQRLFSLARDSRVSFFCHLSSVGVIGRTRLKVVDETSNCQPMSPYERTKLAAERVVAQGFEGGAVVILRPTNIFGAPNVSGWFDASWHAALRRFLNGRERSHLVYVEDVAAAAMFLQERSHGTGVNTFIVSSDEEPEGTNQDVQRVLVALRADAPPPTRLSAPLPVPYALRLLRHGRGNYGNVIYSSAKLRGEGFQFPYGLVTGLKAALRASDGYTGP